MDSKQIDCKMATPLSTPAPLPPGPPGPPGPPQANVLRPYITPTGKVNLEKLREFKFESPPECPVFHPTPEEFAMGPLEYIDKIRDKAEPFGICKIIPPPTYLVPFNIDPNEFHFTPRIQRLSELEAMTRVKLHFHDRIHKFWDLQGVSLRVPTLEKKILDLYTLHRIVEDEGGYEVCTRDRKWAKIANRMSYNKSSASSLRSTYEKYLFPYDVYNSGANIAPEVKEVDITTQSMKDMKLNGHSIPMDKSETDVKIEIASNESFDPHNTELKKLQVFGAGPKMPGVTTEDSVQKVKTCYNCNEIGQTNTILHCNRCQKDYHKLCLFPQFTETSKGQWHCHHCLSKVMPTLPQIFTKEFGFIQSYKTYTLAEFGDMAKKFKREYFDCPPFKVSPQDVEKEFWRIVSSFENNINVEYGADLHTNDYGSGFPTKSSKFLLDDDMEYINSPWNLNNLPTLNGSVFKHINTNINGMIIPWMYVGMCFSAFCWHNEDHWTYSINYLHWGETKTWYGVPGINAEDFENAMKKIAPELFKVQPDLLHHLVTTCNPGLLDQYKVPIFKANQDAGQFIVTFPRSYHSGFNQGFNFAEAVNFASSDWLPIGRRSIADYAEFGRYPVFSHDELICKMADEPSELEMRLAIATYKDIVQMVNTERSLRMDMLGMGMGLESTQSDKLENKIDDERQCSYCKTTCFLSAIRCACSKDKFVCLHHYLNLCPTCPTDNMTVLFRYNMDELKILVEKLNLYISNFSEWSRKATSLLKGIAVLDINNSNSISIASRFKEKASLGEFKCLLEFAEQNKFNRFPMEPYLTLKTQFINASKLSEYSKDLIKFNSEVRKLSCRLKYEQFRSFVNKVNDLHCRIPEQEDLNALYKKVNTIVALIIKHLGPCHNSKACELKDIVDQTKSINIVDFGFQLEQLKSKYLELDWFDKNAQLEKSDLIQLTDIEQLIDIGLKIPSNSSDVLSKIEFLRRSYQEGSMWLEKANKALNYETDDSASNNEKCMKPSFEFLNSLLNWCNDNAKLKKINFEPSYSKLNRIINQAKKWNESANKIYCHIQKNYSNEKTPLLKNVEELVESGRKIDCKLERFSLLETLVSNSKSWIDDLTNVMIDGEFKFYRPIDAIIPRTIDSNNNLTSRSFYLMLIRKGQHRESTFEHELKDDFSNNKIKTLYVDFVHKESVFFEGLREKNNNRRRLMELMETNGNAADFSEKFCICGKEIKDYMIECQLCLDWFHYNCVIDKQSTKRNEQINTKQLFVCCLCSRGKRPKLEEIETLMSDLRKLSLRFIEGELFKCYRERIQGWTIELHQEFKNYPELKALYTDSSQDIGMISDEIKTILENLLNQVYILGVDLEEIASLWRIFTALKKTVLYYSGMINKRKSTNSESKGKKLKKVVSNEDADLNSDGEINYHYAYETCAMKDKCVKPNGKHLNWVFCDKCKDWFHQICQDIVNPEVVENISFFCNACKDQN